MDSEQTYKLEVEALLDNLPQVQVFIEQSAEALGAPFSVVIPMQIALEELFVNICHYAYANESKPGPARFICGVKDQSFWVQLEDDGVAFDPLAQTDPDIAASAEERPIGGLGIFMVKQSMDEFTYERDGGTNRQYLAKQF